MYRYFILSMLALSMCVATSCAKKEKKRCSDSYRHDQRDQKDRGDYKDGYEEFKS